MMFAAMSDKHNAGEGPSFMLVFILFLVVDALLLSLLICFLIIFCHYHYVVKPFPDAERYKFIDRKQQGSTGKKMQTRLESIIKGRPRRSYKYIGKVEKVWKSAASLEATRRFSPICKSLLRRDV